MNAKPTAGTEPLTLTGSKAMSELFERLDQAGAGPLAGMARSLLKDPQRCRDMGLWGPLLARWAERDGAGLMNFVRTELSPAERGLLEGKAWFAWGAADPGAASAAGTTLPVPLARELIAGLVCKDVGLAVDFALKMPDAQFNLNSIMGEVKRSAPELLTQLAPRAVYDGMRGPIQQAQRETLAGTDPSAALALAAKHGNIGHDPVPGTMIYLATQDPVKAAEAFAEMPNSRSRALSALALARTWAAQDVEAATAWTRASLTGPVRQGALLEIAAASGGADPMAALSLVEEAGWTQETNFHQIADNGNMTPSEGRTRPTPVRIGGELLRQLALLDAAAAKSFLLKRVPEPQRAAVAKRAGIPLTP